MPTYPSSEDSTDFLSVTQAAQVLGVTRQRVHDLIKNGQIVARKLGRFYYIEATEIERYKDRPTGKPYQPRTTSFHANSIDECQ